MQRIWRIPRHELWLLMRVCGLLVVLRLLLPRLPLHNLLRWLTPSRIPSHTDPSLLAKAVRYTGIFLRCIPFPLRGPCLPRALVLYYVATRAGFPVQLHCGVRRAGATLEGHAWLSFQGKAFLEGDNPDHSYAITFSFPCVERAKAAAAVPCVRRINTP